MTIKPFIKAIAALAVSGMMLGASANSVGFNQTAYEGSVGDTISVTVNYDYTEFRMFGGVLDLIFDSNVLEFVSFTQSLLPADAQAPASPMGSLTDAGTYTGFGIGTFELFAGMGGAGEMGTFVFNIIGFGNPGTTPCGMTLCLSENDFNPFASHVGDLVGADLLANGNSAAAVVIPVPAAVWFMLSGLGALLGFGRKSA